MTQYIREQGLLPLAEIDRLIAITPTQPLTQTDFDQLGYSDWEEWLTHLCQGGPARDDVQLLLRIF